MGPRYSWAMCAVMFALLLPIYLFWSFLVITVEMSGDYVEPGSRSTTRTALRPMPMAAGTFPRATRPTGPRWTRTTTASHASRATGETHGVRCAASVVIAVVTTEPAGEVRRSRRRGALLAPGSRSRLGRRPARDSCHRSGSLGGGCTLRPLAWRLRRRHRGAARRLHPVGRGDGSERQRI